MTAVHHAAIVVTDLERSLAFWRDGIGLQETMNAGFDGDWTTLFGAPTDHLHSIFLGDPRRPDAGLVELVVFDGLIVDGPVAGPHAEEPGVPPTPRPGFFLLSLYVRLPDTKVRLERLGYTVRSRTEVAGPAGVIPMVTVAGPDGVLVELIGAPRAGPPAANG